MDGPPVAVNHLPYLKVYILLEALSSGSPMLTNTNLYCLQLLSMYSDCAMDLPFSISTLFTVYVTLSYNTTISSSHHLYSIIPYTTIEYIYLSTSYYYYYLISS